MPGLSLRALSVVVSLSAAVGCGGAQPAEPAVAPGAPASAPVSASPSSQPASVAASDGAQPAELPPPPALDLSGIPAASAPLQEISLSAAELGDLLLGALATGHVGLPQALVALKADAKKRVRLIETLGPLLPAIVSSPTFRAAYAHRRASEIAVDPIPKPRPARTAKELHAERVAAMEKAVASVEAAASEPGLPPSSRDAVAQALKQQRQMLDEAKRSTADDEASAAVDRKRLELEQAEYPQRVRARDEEIAKRKQAWPEDVNALVARRLDAFLELTASIDHGAKLVPRGSQKVFADAALEAKPPLWKLAFRAGKPTVDAARALAQTWRRQIAAKK